MQGVIGTCRGFIGMQSVRGYTEGSPTCKISVVKSVHIRGFVDIQRLRSQQERHRWERKKEEEREEGSLTCRASSGFIRAEWSVGAKE